MTAGGELVLWGYAPGNYQVQCHDCHETFVGDKRASACQPCALKRREAHPDPAEQFAAEPRCPWGHSLSNGVDGLWQEENDRLRERIRQLEGELAVAKKGRCDYGCRDCKDSSEQSRFCY